MGRILVVDDEPRMVQLLCGALQERDHEVRGVTSGREALEAVASESFDVVLTDLRMEPIDGMAVIAGVQERSPGTAVVVLTAYGEVETAVGAMSRGAFSYLTKPCNMDEVAVVVERAAADSDLRRQNRALRHALAGAGGTQELIGDSAPMRRLRDLVARVAPSEATVLVRGESGTGKELVARLLHAQSRRADGPFVAVNCAAIPESLLESELFGYRKGAFTGADQDREGMFEAARGGTLFLDEIGEAGAGVQAKLLRVLEQRKINRLGDPREREVDVRIVAATNRPLERAIDEGRFRGDLYYRLLVFPVDVPPLRERPQDVAQLAAHFLAACGRREKLPAAAHARMETYAWPGNVRELRNLIERADILAGESVIRDEHVLLEVGSPGQEGSALRQAGTGPAAGGPAPGSGSRNAAAPGAGPREAEDLDLASNERQLVQAALQRTGGNKSQAARLLGITRRALYSRLKVLGLEDLVQERRSE